MIMASPKNTEELIRKGHFRVTQFTGSSQIAERLSSITNGKVIIKIKY